MALKPCQNCGKEVKQRYASKYKNDFWICEECRDSEDESSEITKLKEEREKLDKKISEIIVTTTYAIEGKRITKYIDVISAEVIEGLSILKDIGAGLADVFGGSAGSYEKALDKMKNTAFSKLKEKAYQLGANAVIGVDLDYGDLRGSMLMLVVNGTAVIVE